MTVGELEYKMSISEFYQWGEYYEWKEEIREREQRKAKRGRGKPPRSRTRRR